MHRPGERFLTLGKHEAVVHDSVLNSGLDSLLISVLFAGGMLLAMFRLDTIFAAPKRAPAVRRPPAGTDEQGRILLSDPDGRPWKDPYGRPEKLK